MYAKLVEEKAAEGDLESGSASVSAGPNAGVRARCLTWMAGSVSWIRETIILVDSYACAATFPIRHASGKNRMIMLLDWDIKMFIGQFILYFTMMYFALQDRHVNVFYRLFLAVTTFDGWEAQITYAVIKILFALSAAPFFTFTIGGLNQLFTHCAATAYTRDGRLVPIDANGLSAYLQWFKEDVLGSEKYRSELEQNFSRKDYERIKKAIQMGERCLTDAWKRPATALKVTRKKKSEIDGVLRGIITRDVASDELYFKCFPDSILVERYIEEKERMKHPQHEPIHPEPSDDEDAEDFKAETTPSPKGGK